MIYDDGFIGDFIFKDEDDDNLEKRALEAKILKQNIDNNTKNQFLYEEKPLFSEIQIIYDIVFDDNTLKNSILTLNITIISLTLLGLLTIFIIYNVRKKEYILSYKDKFIEHSIHEIKTPLSIINLNIQLRNKNLGVDKYSKKIEGALKTLRNSYEDMSFLHTKNQIDYKIKDINLQEILLDRVRYFEIIAQTQFRELSLKVISNCVVTMSKIELERLIDNNLSNAIKYSQQNSKITIYLDKAVLRFHSFGEEIKNRKDIFKRYKRENISAGGHGLGLAIVKDICKKYKIGIEVSSKDGVNIFSYKLNCHKSDTKSK